MQLLYKGYWLEGTPQEITDFLTLNTPAVVTTSTNVELKSTDDVCDPFAKFFAKERECMEDNGKKFLKNNKEE